MRTASWLFAFGLGLRLLFWLATPDRGAAWNLAFQGDAPVWQELAAPALAPDADLQHLLRILPMRPPGMQWLVSHLWNGTDPAWLPRLAFALLGAAIAPLVFVLLRRHLAPRAATFAAALCACATNLMLLSSGLHSELPYLALLLVSWFDQERLRINPTSWVAIRWGALHAILCLLRAEHVLTFAAFLLLLLAQHAQHWRRTAIYSTLSLLLCLMPWHYIAWKQVDTFNTTGAPSLPPAGYRAPGLLPWDTAALTRLRTLPAFQQGPCFQFVTDTMHARGAEQVQAIDLDVLREAYGVWPEALPRPFVCLYGGLNFFLGNSLQAAGGFSQAALDTLPPLTGGPSRYPPGLVQVLPRNGTLALSYPPHLDLLVHGYRRGFAEITADPAAAIARIGKKVYYGLQGATGGVGGYAIPIGLSGERRAVDLVTAQGAWATTWRSALALVAAAGLWSLRREPWLHAWLVFALTKLVVIAAFFGYARQGALCVPVFAIGLAAVVDRFLLPRVPLLTRKHLGAVLLVGILVLELFRCLSIEVAIDDQGATSNPLGPVDHAAHQLHYR